MKKVCKILEMFENGKVIPVSDIYFTSLIGFKMEQPGISKESRLEPHEIGDKFKRLGPGLSFC